MLVDAVCHVNAYGKPLGTPQKVTAQRSSPSPQASTEEAGAVALAKHGRNCGHVEMLARSSQTAQLAESVEQLAALHL